MKRIRLALLTTDARDTFGPGDGPNFGTAIRALLEGFEGRTDIEVHVVSCLKNQVESTERIAQNIQFHAINTRGLGGLKSLYAGSVVGVRRLLSKIQPDIVHGQGTERECSLAAVLSGFPNVITIHGNMGELYDLGLLEDKVYGFIAKSLESWALRNTQGVFCNSNHTRSLVVSKTRSAWLVPNAIRSVFLSQKSDASVSDRESVPTVICVGTINRNKGQLEILRKVKWIRDSGLPVRIVFVGDNNESSAYGREFAVEMNEGKQTELQRFSGFLRETELIELMDNVEGMIHFPSSEAFGLVVAEGLARGLKMFAADVGGIRDICDGVPGAELFSTIDDLGVGVMAWLKSGAPRQGAASAFVARRYSPERVADQHVEIYAKVLR